MDNTTNEPTSRRWDPDLVKMALFLAVAVALVLGGICAQVVTLANYTPTPFVGWHRVNVDVKPQSLAGVLYVEGMKLGTLMRRTDAIYRVGRQTGLDTWAVDVHCTLAPGQVRSLDLSTFDDVVIPNPQLPADLLGYFGGWPMVNGTTLSFVSLQVDGAGYSAHLRARVPGTRLLVCDLWATWYPGQPWCHAEALLTASNPAVPDLVETLAAGVSLTFGDALVVPLGGAAGQLVANGTVFADGQARAVPLTIVWLRHMPIADWVWPWGDDELAALVAVLSAEADKQWAVCGVGIAQLLADGSPTYPVGFEPAAWAASKWAASVARLHEWDPPVLGVAPTSGVTGRQEDQWFVRGESLLPGGVGGEMVAYLSALKWANRPCHHREADGSPLDASRHTARPLIFWDGRPHGMLWNLVDRLGKPTPMPALSVPGGWWGPDVEHWLINTLAAATRLTGSPCLQSLLRAQAAIYPLQWTTTRGWSTSQPYVSRAIGYECANAVHLWRTLEDRELATAVLAHWHERWVSVLRPYFAAQVEAFPSGAYMDPRLDDPRLGAGWWWIPWQQGLGSYGCDLAGKEFDEPELREWGLRFARQVVADAWVQVGARWESSAVHPVVGDAPHDESFNHYGLSMAVAVVLRHDPLDERARSIWTYLQAGAAAIEQTCGLPPGVR